MWHYTRIGRYEYPLRAMAAAALAGVVTAVVALLVVVAGAEAASAPDPQARAAVVHTVTAPRHLPDTGAWGTIGLRRV